MKNKQKNKELFIIAEATKTALAVLVASAKLLASVAIQNKSLVFLFYDTNKK